MRITPLVLFVLFASVLLVNPAAAETFNGALTPQHQVDIIPLNMPENGTLTVAVTGSPDQNIKGISLLDSDQETVLESLDRVSDGTETGDFSLLRAGPYYLRLRKDGRDSYSGPYSVRTTVTGQDFAPDKEPNDSFETAGRIVLGTVVSGHLGARGQQRDRDMDDYWKLVLPEDGDLELDVTTSDQLNLHGGVSIYDSDRENRLYREYQGPGENQVHRRRALKAGTYYILIGKDGRNSYWGSYQLRASFTPAPVGNDQENNDEFSRAIDINSSTITGHLGYQGQGDDDGSDWYRISLDAPGEVTLEVTTSEELNLRGGVYVYGGDGVSKLYGKSQSPDTTVEHKIELDAGRYYVLIEKDGRRSYWGWYTLSLSGINLPPVTSKSRLSPAASASNENNSIPARAAATAPPGEQAKSAPRTRAQATYRMRKR